MNYPSMKSKELCKSEIMQYCIDHGITVYPMYLTRKTTITTSFNGFKKKYNLSERKWYLEVCNNGNIITYPTPVGDKKILKGKDYMEQIHKVYLHWYEILIKQKK